MEQLTKEQTGILNGLIQINNDRITGYKRALEDLSEQDAGLGPVFSGFIDQSKEINEALKELLQGAGEEPRDETTVPGRIYRAWMDAKAAFTGGSRKTVLSACEGGEDASQRAYKEALAESLPVAIADILSRQRDELRQSHDKIKNLRDNV